MVLMKPFPLIDEIYSRRVKGGVMRDKAIVDLYWQRDENAIKATAEKYENYLFKISYNILTDEEDSKESVNDTYLAAWKSIPPHRPSILSTYLGKLTRRISIDVFRRKKREKRKAGEYSLSLSELTDMFSSEPQPDEKLEVKLLCEKINCFLETLKPDARIAFIGRYYYMDPIKEIARYSSMSEAKTKTLLYRTRLDLRQYLEKEGFII